MKYIHPNFFFFIYIACAEVHAQLNFPETLADENFKGIVGAIMSSDGIGLVGNRAATRGQVLHPTFLKVLIFYSFYYIRL